MKTTIRDIPARQRENYEALSLGFKPSGRLHLGSVLTLAHAFTYAQQHPTTSIQIDVMDLDYDPQRGNQYPSFLHLRDQTGRLMSDLTAEELQIVTDDLTDICGLPTNPARVRKFSQTLRQPAYFERIARKFRDRTTNGNIQREIFGKTKYHDWAVPFTPICPCCNTSNTHFGRFNNDKTRLSAICQKFTCPNGGQRYDVPFEPGQFNMHYFVDPSRDLFPTEDGKTVGLHLFGGDYERPHGPQRTVKATKIANITAMLSEPGDTQPDHFIGPTLTWGGEKVSKSAAGVAYSTQPDRKELARRLIEAAGRGTPEIEFGSIRPGND